MNQKTGNTLESIQVARGFAALAVVFYHVSLLFAQKSDLNLFGGLGKYGYMGVPFFFVLSGFIIGYAHFKDIGHHDRLRTFLFKRFVRVYPIYWLLSVLFMIAAAAGLGEPDFSFSAPELLQAHLLIHFTPQFDSPPLKVAWTLFFEVRFYCVFALAILYPRIVAVLSGLWMVAIAAVTPWNALSTEWLSYWNYGFPIGLSICVLYLRVPVIHWRFCVALGATILLAVLVLTPIGDFHGGRSLPMVGMMWGFGLVILGLSMLERVRDLNLPRSLMFLGNASFSVYLAHSAVISVVGAIIFKLHLLRFVAPEVLYLPIVVTATLAGIIVHLLIERPLIGALNSRFRGASANAGKAALIVTSPASSVSPLSETAAGDNDRGSGPL